MICSWLTDTDKGGALRFRIARPRAMPVISALDIGAGDNSAFVK